MDWIPDLYEYIISLDTINVKAVIPLLVAMISYFKAKKYVEAFKYKSSDLINEFYFLEDMICNSDKIPRELKNEVTTLICKIAKPNIGFVSKETKDIVQYIFDKKKDIQLIRSSLSTDKLKFKNDKLEYKKNYKLRSKFFSCLYFVFAFSSLIPNILVQFSPFNNMKIGQFVTISIVFLFFFGGLAYISLKRYAKFYWADKVLTEMQ